MGRTKWPQLSWIISQKWDWRSRAQSRLILLPTGIIWIHQLEIIFIAENSGTHPTKFLFVGLAKPAILVESNPGGNSYRARVCKRLRSPLIDSKESIPPAYVKNWQAGTTNKIVVPGSRLHRLVESIPGLGSLNIYKCGLSFETCVITHRGICRGVAGPWKFYYVLSFPLRINDASMKQSERKRSLCI